MSIYHKDKCTRQKALAFKEIVKDFLHRENLSYKAMRAFCSYDGYVRIYTGGTVKRLPLRRRRRLIDADPVTRRMVYELHNEPIIEPESIAVYHSDWEFDSNAEQEHIKNSLGAGK